MQYICLEFITVFYRHLSLRRSRSFEGFASADNEQSHIINGAAAKPLLEAIGFFQLV